MSEKKKYVLMRPQCGARIYTNPDNLDELRAQGELLENPDLSAVAGIPPELWALKNGQVVEYVAPAPEAPAAPAQDEVLEEMGQQARVLLFKKRRKRKWLRLVAALTAAALLFAVCRGA